MHEKEKYIKSKSNVTVIVPGKIITSSLTIVGIIKKRNPL